jgi:hypothetical protein
VSRRRALALRSRPQTHLDIFRVDPAYEEEERKYAAIAKEVLGEDEEDEGGAGGPGSGGAGARRAGWRPLGRARSWDVRGAARVGCMSGRAA